MQKITPYLWFNNQTDEAVRFYTSVFKNGKIHSFTRIENVPGQVSELVTATFEIAGMQFMALDGGPEFSFTPAISFFVSCETREEIDTLWNALSEGGTVLMEYGEYPFSEKFGWVNDRYGVSWQLILTGAPQQISPFFLFVGNQHGRAEEAINYYTSLFDNSSIEQIIHYGKDMGEPEGTVMQGYFKLAGQNFIAMDSSLEHNFTFTPATSLYINCKDQEEVDYFWEKLTDGGAPWACGWLTDRFGVSWQVIPEILETLMRDPDKEKANRVMQAMLQMGKIEIDQLKEAYELV